LEEPLFEESLLEEPLLEEPLLEEPLLNATHSGRHFGFQKLFGGFPETG
jgi:hypothetical protein